MPITGSSHASYQSFLDYLKFEKRYSVHTITAYQGDLRDFFDYLETQYGSVAGTEISMSIVRSWLASLRADDVQPKSISRKISSLRSFFKYQLKTGTITSSPMMNIKAPQIGR